MFIVILLKMCDVEHTNIQERIEFVKSIVCWHHC